MTAAVVLTFLVGEGGDLDPPVGRSGTARNAVEGASVGSDGVCSSLGVLNPGVDIQVADTIAGFVVADVVVDASLTAPPDLKTRNLRSNLEKRWRIELTIEPPERSSYLQHR